MQSVTLTFADAKLARQIATAAYPDAKRITIIEHGYDNVVALIDTDYTLRFPRNNNAYVRIGYEKQVLDSLIGLHTVHIPKALSVHNDPPYLVTNYTDGTHLSPAEITRLPQGLQKQLGERVAQFAYTLHTAISVDTVRQIRVKTGIDELHEAPWEVYFKNALLLRTFPTPLQDAIAKKYYKKWENIGNQSPLVAVHDDLHTANMLFEDNQLYGVLDFGDTNIGTAEEELRQLYLINETVLQAAVAMYSNLSGQTLDIETVKTWAITQELAAYSERLYRHDTGHPAFTRATGNLNNWFADGRWDIPENYPSE